MTKNSTFDKDKKGTKWETELKTERITENK